MHARGHIDDMTMEYLTPEDPKPGSFYRLPNETILGEGLCQPMVNQVKRYRNLLIFAFRWKPSITHQRYCRLFDENLKCYHSRKYHACYHGCNFRLHEYSPWWRNCGMQTNMGTTNSSRTSDRMFSGDAYTGCKTQQFYFWRKPLSSNKWDSYGNQYGTLLC